MGEGSQFDPTCGFSKIVFFREGVESLFFVTFNIIISDIFAENLEDMKIFLFSINYFFGVFDISLMQKTNTISI